MMAFTPEEEQQLKDILDNYSGIQDLSAAATDILAALGYGDIRVIDLPLGMALQANDVFYLAQSGADVKASISQLSDYVITAILPTLQSQISAGLADNKFYFFGQF